MITLAELWKMITIYPPKGCVGARILKQWRRSQDTVSSLFLCQCPNREALEEGSSSIPVRLPRDALTVVSPSSPAALGVILLKPFCTPLATKGDLLPMSSLKGGCFSTAGRVISREPQPLWSPSQLQLLPLPFPSGISLGRGEISSQTG